MKAVGSWGGCSSPGSGGGCGSPSIINDGGGGGGGGGGSGTPCGCASHEGGASPWQ